MSENTEAPELNVLTVGSIAVVAYCLTNLIHEGGGHGGACLLVGGKPEVLNAIFFSCDESMVSTAGQRFVSASGSIIDLILGGIAFAILRSRRALPDSLRYFLWLFWTTNLLMAFGYFLFSGVAGVGDWARVIDGFEPHLVFRIGLVAAGVVLYFWVAPSLLMPDLMGFVGGGGPARTPQAVRLTLIPYVVGGITFLAAGLLNPYGLKLVLVSAVAASFGGTSLLAWYPAVAMKSPAPPMSDHRLVLKASAGWTVAAVITLVLFVGVLGRGISFTGP